MLQPLPKKKPKTRLAANICCKLSAMMKKKNNNPYIEVFIAASMPQNCSIGFTMQMKFAVSLQLTILAMFLRIDQFLRVCRKLATKSCNVRRKLAASFEYLRTLAFSSSKLNFAANLQQTMQFRKGQLHYTDAAGQCWAYIT
jgi:hypothetical protein